VALLRADSPIYEFVGREAVARLVSEHQASRRDHSHLIWRLMVLDLWLAALGRGTLAAPTGRLLAAAA
jgi:hypothetical protein